MKQITFLKSIILLTALILSCASAWATDFTLSSANNVTIDGITVSFAKGSGSTAPTWYSAGLRLYARNTITIESSNTITGITFDWEKQGNKAFASATANTGSYTHPSAAGGGTWTGQATSVTFTLGSSGQLQLNTLHVTTSGGGSSAAATTTTIITNGITNTDLKNGTAAGSLSASVTLTSGGTAVPDATVTWSGDNNAVATINANTGVVTLVGEGDVNFMASYAGVANTYAASTSSKYKMAVTDTTYPTSTITFTAKCNGTGTTKLDDSDAKSSDVTWTVSSDGTESNFDTSRGIHYGTGSASVQYITLSTSGINGTIKKVVVNASTASGVSATVDVKVGGSAFGGDAQSLSTSATDYTFTATGTAKGQILVTVTKASSSTGALYVKSVKVYYEPSTDPVISADDVNITYNATNGSIGYSLENATGNVSATVTTGDWLTLGTITSSSVPFACSANPNTTSRTATVTLSFTGADDKVVTVTQAAAPVVYSTIPALFEAATTTETDVIVTFSSWVVSGVSTNGKNVFVTDNNGNGFVLYFSSDQSSTFESGKVITGSDVSCSLVLYNGFAELKNVDTNDLSISDGGSVTTISNIALSSLSGVNTGALVHYENLAGTISDNKYYLSDGTTSLQVYNSLYADAAIESNKHYTITGIYQQYNNTKEILPRSADDIEEYVSSEPSIDLASYVIESTAAGKEGTINVTCNNMGASPSLTIAFFEADGTTPATYPWVDADINNDGNVYYLIGENTEAARTAYFKVYCEASAVYSNLVTISQAAPVIDYAILPFTYNDGISGIASVDGLTEDGLGSDYKTENTKLKFDGADDYLKLKINQAIPGTYTLAFDIKGNTFSGGTFKVQISADDNTYTDLMVFSSSILDGTYKFDNLPETVRFIKWIYVEKSNGNVGLGNIKLNQPSDTEDATKSVTASRSDGRYWATFYCSGACYTLPEGAKAYTMDSEKNLYLLGNGSVIPANTAVIIIADEEGDAESISLTLTKTTDTAVAISGSENILHGSSYDIAVSRTGGTPYVLGNKGTPKVLNFYKYVGTGTIPTIPANRAYYVK